jgi:hypothetical protein
MKEKYRRLDARLPFGQRPQLLRQAPEELRHMVELLQIIARIRRMQPWSSIAARHRLATLVLFRLGGGGNCRPLREHCSPVVDQALQSMRCHIQRGVIHRALVAGSRFGAFPS